MHCNVANMVFHAPSRTLRGFPLLLAALCLLSVVALVQGSGFSDDVVPDPSLYEPDTIIVRFAAQTGDGPVLCSASENAHSLLGADVVEDLSDLVPGMQVVELPEGVSVDEAVDYYNRLSDVVYA